MKKPVFYIIIALILVNCNSISSTKKKDKTDSDSPVLVERKNIKTIKAIQRDSLKNIDIRKLLDDPINLKQYLALKVSANSTGFNSEGKYYKPNYEGFYYQYFLFGWQFGEHGLQIKTYIRGEEIKKYNENDEILIELVVRRQDKDLGVLDLVNRTVNEIKKCYGKPDYEDYYRLIYWSGKNCLILTKIKEKEIFIVRYSKVNKKINDVYDIHEDIRNINPYKSSGLL